VLRKGVISLLLVLVACAEPAESVSTTAASTTSTTSAATTTTASTTTTEPTTTIAALTTLTYTSIAEGLSFPVLLTSRPGDAFSYLLTKDGRVWVVDENGVTDPPVLDISSAVRNQGEQGLLGMAIHPRQPDRVFLHYTAGDGATVVSEFLVAGDAIDAGSERVILRLDQPAGNHNGGMVVFGPDDYLYLALGDGGGANDTFANGQNPGTLLATILRLDVEGEPYAIPPDNPFVEGNGAPEVWSFGLRNPWRFWFDGDQIYIADVGQNAYEEVNVASSGEAGLNYGWPVTEGLHCFNPPQGCDTDGLTLPVLEVAHGDGGTCSITGGPVYRGSAIPELDGHYFFSDYCGGYLRSFLYQGGEMVEERDWTAEVGVPGPVTSFGIDGQGEMYVLTNSALLRVDPVR
jgi:glucose/arabinose dehydrogenase